MLLNQSLTKLKKLKGKTVGNLLSEFKSNIKEFKINKGGIGQMLLLYLGLPLDSKLTDFDDGELKTNKTDKDGNSKETIFITQISSIIDELISDNPKNFYQSNLFKKIKNVALVGICKDDKNYNNWKFTYFYNFNYQHNKELFEEFNNDYITICDQLKRHIETSEDKFIHTSNGKFIQIRSKDSKPYHAIFSKERGRYISNKNHAFYFKKDLTKYLENLK